MLYIYKIIYRLYKGKGNRKSIWNFYFAISFTHTPLLFFTLEI
ncbi:hypothetical protein CP10139811_1556 [Chlamydia ibidis]|uniref:Uncharacterized protein n=1 Tax=Chlamydia ibidis TaxID=1405396 RepID=S7J4Z4_9CHLA|nr:hypothetical protein CP10139811_1556 [Chlamydia ibidis]